MNNFDWNKQNIRKAVLIASALFLLLFVGIFVSGGKIFIPSLEGPILPPVVPAYMRNAQIFSNRQMGLVSVEVITPYIARPNQIALTFDDGPNPRTTSQILEILERYHVPATFFVVGMHAKLDPQLVRDMTAASCEVGVHTFHHVDLCNLDEAAIARELNDTNDILTEILGSRIYFFRPPGGNYDKKVLKVAKENNYAMVLWDINPADFVDLKNHMPTEPDILSLVISKLRSDRRGRIILLHEGMENTIESLPAIIEYGLYHGYTFTTVSGLRYKAGFKMFSGQR